MTPAGVLVELTGLWITGPVDLDRPVVTAKHVFVPRGADAVVRVRLVDQNLSPVDPIRFAGGVAMTLSIGFAGRALKRVSFVANPSHGVNAFDALLAGSDTKSLRGTLLYDVSAVIGTVTQQVVQTSYWDSEVSVFRS